MSTDQILARVEEKTPMSLDDAIKHLRGEQARATESAKEFGRMEMPAMVETWQAIAAAYDVVLDRLRLALHDVQRVDWIEAQRASVVPAWNGTGEHVGYAARASHSWDVARHTTLRGAIDAALSSTSEAPR